MQADTKVWDKASVQDLIARSDVALARALWNLYQRQTAVEQCALQTIEHNGRGFNGRDAEFLSDIAKKLPRYGFHMTVGQIKAVRPKMMKYWKQLLQEIEAKGGQVRYSANSSKSETAKAPKGDTPISLPHGAPAEQGAMWGAF